MGKHYGGFNRTLVVANSQFDGKPLFGSDWCTLQCTSRASAWAITIFALHCWHCCACLKMFRNLDWSSICMQTTLRPMGGHLQRMSMISRVHLRASTSSQIGCGRTALSWTRKDKSLCAVPFHVDSVIYSWPTSKSVQYKWWTQVMPSTSVRDLGIFIVSDLVTRTHVQ